MQMQALTAYCLPTVRHIAIYTRRPVLRPREIDLKWESDTVALCKFEWEWHNPHILRHDGGDTAGTQSCMRELDFTLYLLKQNKNDNSIFIIRSCVNLPDPLQCSTRQLSRYLSSQTQCIAAVGTAWSLLGSSDWS